MIKFKDLFLDHKDSIILYVTTTCLYCVLLFMFHPSISITSVGLFWMIIVKPRAGLAAAAAFLCMVIFFNLKASYVLVNWLDCLLRAFPFFVLTPVLAIYAILDSACTSRTRYLAIAILVAFIAIPYTWSFIIIDIPKLFRIIA